MSNTGVYLTREEILHPYANIIDMRDDKRRKAGQLSKTVFARITASPEVLAKEFVEPYTRWGEDGHIETLWRSNFRELSGMLFDTKEEAIAATVARLKEVCVSQNAVDYTQARLSKVDDTQMEVAE